MVTNLWMKGSKPEVISKVVQTTTVLTQHKPIWNDNSIFISSKADIIVCTIHPSLDLRKGVLSKSILEEGGQSIQQELKDFSEKYGTVRSHGLVRTKGGNLRCKYMFHLSLPSWREDHGQRMRSAVKECLDEASARHARSIAFPTLGTGRLGYPGDQVAAMMFSVIGQWFQDHRDSSVKEVQIIVFSKDSELLQAFKTPGRYDRSYSGARSRGHRDSEGGDDSDDTSSLMVSVGKLKVTIKEGNILLEPCDAIVNSSNDNLDLSKGVLSKSISKICGENIIVECRSQRDQMREMGVAITKVDAAGLECGRIIHVSAERFKQDWCKGILAVLQKADEEDIQSVALPALGTGGRGSDSQQLAQAMHEAVAEFSHKAHTVKEVRIVVFQKQLLQPYIAAFKPSETPRGAEGSDSDYGEPAAYNEVKECQAVDVYIYSNSETAIKEAQEKISRHMKDIYMSRKETSPLIAGFSENQVKDVMKLQHKFSVLITMDKKKNTVTFAGVDIEVAKAVSAMKDILLDATNQRHLAAGGPPVRWQYETSKDKYADFDQENTVAIEAAFKKKEPAVEFQDKRGRKYKIVFKDRKEYCLDDRRAPGVNVRRRDILTEKAKEISLPKHWEHMKGDRVKLVDLKPDSGEYKKVAAHFGSQATVRKIQRVQNPTLFQQYKVKKRELELYNPKGTENEKRLFHGTSSDSINGIITNGFNRSYCGKNGTALGAGVYFATDSVTSMGYAQGKQMFQALVLVGEHTQGNSSMKMAPNKPNSSRPYDSVSNSPSNPSVFVIFHDSQAYPEYLISF